MSEKQQLLDDSALGNESVIQSVVILFVIMLR